MSHCQCGCGQPAPLAPHSRASKGMVKGQPLRFIHGHNGRMPVRERFDASYTVDARGCWIWSGPTNSRGYGRIYVDGPVAAHRWSYEHFVGEIPDGLVLDHLCRVTLCVRPDHLEPVTQAENIRRGEWNQRAAEVRTARATCKNNHLWTDENTLRDAAGHRVCRECRRMYKVRYRTQKAVSA